MNPTDLGRRLRAAAAAPRARRRRTRVLAVESLEPRDCPAPVVSIELPRTPIIEGDRATFTVRLSQPSSTPQRIAVSAVAETATLGRDFMFSNPTQLLFTPGQTVKTFSVQTFTDTVTEPIETFRINATPLTIPNAATVSARASIYELVETTVTAQDVRITEGNTGTVNATFTLTLSGRPTLPVYVNYTTQDVTATAGTDYTAASGQVFFNPGQTTKTVTVPIAGDQIAEFDETFRLQLSTQTRGSTIVTPTVTGTIVNDEIDTPGFQITIRFDDVTGGPVPASVRTATLRAATRWSRVITGDVPGVMVGPIFIDDFEMVVQMGLLGGAPEGPGGVLANAQPTAFRGMGTGLPYSGITGIDPNDVGGNQDALMDTVTHEIGHALGFAPGADVFSRWIVGDTFTGPNAVREFNAVFGRTGTSVPLQPGVRAHWDEAVFGNELMSPTTFLNGDFISRVTIGALADMGYTVNYAAAEAYVPPVVMIPGPSVSPGPIVAPRPRLVVSPLPTVPPATPAPPRPVLAPNPRIVSGERGAVGGGRATIAPSKPAKGLTLKAFG
jgi:hypothetical protein